MTVPAFASADPVENPDCAPYVIIGARGTGADKEASGKLSNVVRQSAEAVRAIVNANRDLDETDDSVVEFFPLRYPANGGGEFMAGNSSVYQASVKKGRDEVKRLLTETCPNSRFIGIGYSQGAQAIGGAVYQLGEDGTDMVEGIITFGDPTFNNFDDESSFSSFDPDHSGLFGSRREWALDIDAPVVADCLKLDIMCQGRKWQVVDGKRQSVIVVSDLAWDNGWDNPFRNHEKYPKGKKPDTLLAACELARQLALTNPDFDGAGICPGTKSRVDTLGPGATTGLDVAILVDTTPGSAGTLPELQDRASDLIHQASHDSPGTRYAVIGYSRGSVINATGGFTDDPAEAAAAIEGLEIQTGNYGAIYSAINEANALDRREDARNVTLTLSTSRACPSQMCNYEAETGVQFSLLYPPGDVRRAGVYTLEHQWFFESAGWAQAMEEAFTSRPGEPRSDSGWVDELQRVFGDALTTEYEDVILGTSDTVVGQIGHFNAEDAIPFYSDSPARRLVWSIERTGDVTPDPGSGGGGPTETVATLGPMSASRGLGIETTPPEEEGESEPGDDPDNPGDPGEEPGDDPENPGDPGEEPGDDPENPGDPGEEPDPTPVLPDDEGPNFQAAFTESGMYTVTLTAYLDGTVKTYQQVVRVDDLPTEAPGSPLLTSTVTDGIQTMRWVPGTGERATAYGLVDSDGTVTEIFVPRLVEDSNGVSLPQTEIDLDGGAPYRLIAYNEIGGTPAIGLVMANAGSYAHVSTDAGEPTGGTLELSGVMSPELAAVLGEPSPTSTSLAGSYEAQFVSPAGDSFGLDMVSADASLNTHSNGDDTTTWSALFELRDAVTTGGESLATLLDDGLAEEILAGGHVELVIDGQPIRFKVAAAATVAELGEFVIDSDSPPPSGNAASVIAIDQAQHTLSLTDHDAPNGLQFVVDAADPLQDWSTATITDIRTWIGTAEVSNTLSGVAIDVVDAGDGTPGSATVSFSGDVVGGTPSLVREFLNHGTVSFKVNGGAATAVLLTASVQDAESMFPNTDPPRLFGRGSVSFMQYAADKEWRPVIDWGSSAPWERNVYVVDGSLPEGLSWDSWSHRLTGTAVSSGTYTFSLTAMSNTGQSTKTYTLTVGSSSAPSAVPDSDAYVTLGEEGEVSLDAYGYGWLRPDNPAVATELPIVGQVPSDGYLAVSVSNAALLDASGTNLGLTGSFTLQISRQPWGDSLWLSASSLESVDPNGPSAAELIYTAERIVFTDDLGNQNMIRFASLG